MRNHGDGEMNMETGRRTTVYLEADVSKMLQLQDINVSKTINDLLRSYLRIDDAGQVKTEIKEHQSKILVLEKRLKRMHKDGSDETRMNGLKKETWEQLKGYYDARRGQGVNNAMDEDWILTPKNQQRCMVMGKDPLVVLSDLKRAFSKRKPRP
jgi:hypothetical protein